MSVGAALCGAASTIAASDLRTVQLWLYRVMTITGPDGRLRQRLLRRP
jgi:hypothetical protein